jgi:hypothetical protein
MGLTKTKQLFSNYHISRPCHRGTWKTKAIVVVVYLKRASTALGGGGGGVAPSHPPILVPKRFLFQIILLYDDFYLSCTSLPETTQDTIIIQKAY